jgi:hypothetical protein
MIDRRKGSHGVFTPKLIILVTTTTTMNFTIVSKITVLL